MSTPSAKPKLWAMPRKVWQQMDPKKADSWLAAIMGILLRSAGILLLIFAVLIIWRMLRHDGYVLEGFSMPKSLEESGYNSRVAALHMQDAISILKNEAASVKKDALNVGNDEENAAMNVQVMGVEISLNSIAYQLRHLLGRQQKRMTGEFFHTGNQLTLFLRMTGFPNARFETIILPGGEISGVQKLLRLAAEKVLERTDPYRLAVVYYRRGDYPPAVELVRSIIRERPTERVWAYHAWGNILKSEGRMEEAADKFRQAISIDSAFGIAYTQLGYTLNAMRKRDEAIAMFQKGLSINPENPDAWMTLAWQFHAAGLIEKSDSAFAEAIRQSARYGKESMAWQGWIGAKIERKDMAGAQAIAQKALHTVAETSDGYVTKAIVHFLQQDSLKAYEYTRKALDLDPNNVVAANMYARALYAEKQYRRMNHFVREFRWPGYMQQMQVQLLNLSAMAHNLQGEHDSAYAVIRRAISLDSTAAAPYSTLAETYAFQGKTDRFFELLEKSLRMGLPLDVIQWQEEPYRRFSNQPRMIRLKQQHQRQ